MLTISDEVKALFSSDTVHKNFHVRFPNGEYTDLNNEDIVSESVQFTESLCSQQYFKFGLAEASQIEFVAVGIPNVRGANIECAIEIDCTRLGDAWAAEHLPDLTLPFLTAQTCFYGDKLYYRVPYGRFKIDTCPRNHGAMYQRQITAYSDSFTDSPILNWIEDWKDSGYYYNTKKYTPKIYPFINALAADTGEYVTKDWNVYASYDPSTPQSWQNVGTLPVTINGSSSTAQISVTRGGFVSSNVLSFASLTPLDAGKIVISADFPSYKFGYLENWIISELETLGISHEGYQNVKAYFDDNFSYATLWGSPVGQFNPWAELSGVQVVKPSTSYYRTNNHVELLPQTTHVALYPYVSDSEAQDYRTAFSVWVPLKVRISNLPDGQSVMSDYAMSEDKNITIRYNTFSSPLDDIFNFSFDSTLKTKIESLEDHKKYTAYSFANAFSKVALATSFLELCGWFLKPNRSGGLTFFQMSENLTPISVSSSDWSSFWWDETPIDSIGLVNVIYTQDGEEQQQSFNIGDGNSVYTIENNEVLKSAELDETTMQSILTTYFEPNASVVNFTPVELEMRGLPYLESGDYIELTAEDGETVQTYILAQTISGIQNLRADVTSTTGDLLEVRDE